MQTFAMHPNRAPQQLDIFADSRDVMLRNEVLGAIEQFDAGAARDAWRRLAAEYPDYANLPALQLLIHWLEKPSTDALPDHAALARERLAIEQGLAPAAVQAMGHDASSLWLMRPWRALAARAQSLPFATDYSDDHAAALWLRGEDWAAAAQAVAGIESWRRIPAPLAWMTLARHRLEGLDPCWPLLAELAWMAPARLAVLLDAMQDPLLLRLRARFEAEFDGDAAVGQEADDLAWFPAWVLTVRSALAPHLSAAQAGQQGVAERGMRSVVALLLVERQGRHAELIARRSELRDLHAGLYAAYMATR